MNYDLQKRNEKCLQQEQLKTSGLKVRNFL